MHRVRQPLELEVAGRVREPEQVRPVRVRIFAARGIELGEHVVDRPSGVLHGWQATTMTRHEGTDRRAEVTPRRPGAGTAGTPGRTDVPLTAEGEEAARTASARLATYSPALVLVSPLVRARRTAELAGLSGEADADLLEWDYGVYEGRTTQGIKDDLGDPAWSVWTTLDGLGESVDDVGARAARVLTRCQPVVESGDDVVLVAHAHLLRILTAAAPRPARGRRTLVRPAARGGILGRVLGVERSNRALLGWGALRYAVSRARRSARSRWRRRRRTRPPRC